MRRRVKIMVLNVIFPDCWYSHLIGSIIDVLETDQDFVVLDKTITNDLEGEYNNTGLICKTDAIVIETHENK